VFGIPVGRETRRGRVVTARHAFDDEQEKTGGHDGSQNLCHYVTGRVLRVHLLGDENAERHGRVDVAARNWSDGVDHRQQRQAEGERDAEEADLISRQHGAPATGENQHKGSHEFGHVPFHVLVSFQSQD
jgi:hypothetical protein